MSTNLHCNKIELVQTPTLITYMCMSGPNGIIATSLSGDNAKQAIQIYCYWIEHESQILFNRDTNARDNFNHVRETVNDIRELLRSVTGLKVWME